MPETTDLPPFWTVLILTGFAIGCLPLASAFLTVALMQHDETRSVLCIFACFSSGIGVAGMVIGLTAILKEQPHG